MRKMKSVLINALGCSDTLVCQSILQMILSPDFKFECEIQLYGDTYTC